MPGTTGSVLLALAVGAVGCPQPGAVTPTGSGAVQADGTSPVDAGPDDEVVPPERLRPTMELEALALLWESPADSAVQFGGQLILAEASGTVITAVALDTGRDLWSLTLEEPVLPDEWWTFASDRLFAHANGSFHLIDTSRGAPLARVALGPSAGCRVQHRNGACGIDCGCSFQVVDCATGAPVSWPVARAERASESPTVPPDHRTCDGFAGVVLAGADALSVASFFEPPICGTVTIPAPSHLPGRPDEARSQETRQCLRGGRGLAAVDGESGLEVWHISQLPAAYDGDVPFGSAPGGRLCWLAAPGWESLALFDCRRERSWTRPLELGGPGREVPPVWVPEADGLFVVDRAGNQARLVSAESGTVAWQTDLAEAQWAWPVGAAAAQDRELATGPAELLLVSPEDGSTTTTLAVPEGHVLHVDRHGFLVAAATLVRFDPSGNRVAESAWEQGSGPALRGDFIVGSTESEVVVLDARDLRVLGRFARAQGESLEVVAAERPAPGYLALAWRSSDTARRVVRVFRVLDGEAPAVAPIAGTRDPADGGAVTEPWPSPPRGTAQPLQSLGGQVSVGRPVWSDGSRGRMRLDSLHVGLTNLRRGFSSCCAGAAALTSGERGSEPMPFRLTISRRGRVAASFQEGPGPSSRTGISDCIGAVLESLDFAEAPPEGGTVTVDVQVACGVSAGHPLPPPIPASTTDEP